MPDPIARPRGAFEHLAWLSWRVLAIGAAGAMVVAALVLAGVIVLPLFLGLLVTGGVGPIADRLRGRGMPGALASLASPSWGSSSWCWAR